MPDVLSKELLTQVATYVGEWLSFRQQTSQATGIQAAILHEGDVLLSCAYGLADLESDTPLRTDHLFRIASQSKCFTAVAVMQLVEQQRLRLDDPLAHCLPWLPESLLHQIGAVTARELLTHSAGLIRDGIDANFWQFRHPFPDRDELVGVMGDHPALLKRNEDFKYSNLGYALLGLVIEHVSGLSYNDYVTTHIVQALGIANTGPELPADRVRECATGYTAVMPSFPQRPIGANDTRAYSPAVGSYSTAEDLCRFAAALFSGSSVLVSPDSQRQMLHPEWKVPGAQEQYGFGFRLYDIGDRRIVGNAGLFPGYMTSTMLDPERRLAAAVLTNCSNGDAWGMSAAVFRLVNFVVAKVSPSPSPEGIDPDRFTGRFMNMWGVMDVVRFGDQLFALWPEQTDPTHTAVELQVVDETTLRLMQGSGYSSQGELLHYTFADDQVASVHGLCGQTSVPVEAYRQALSRVSRAEVGWW